MRVGAIDVGTNSVHLLVADVLPDGEIQVVEKARAQVMLGSGGLGQQRLADDAFQRGIDALTAFREACDSLGVDDIHAAATSAVREASNGPDFCSAVKSLTGIHVGMISGQDEGRLIYLGVRADLDFSAGRVLLFDLGGGSTEFILCDAQRPLLIQSLRIGHIRLADGKQTTDPLTEENRLEMAEAVREALRPLTRRIDRRRVHSLVGTSGTVRALGRIAARARGEEAPVGGQGLVLHRKEVEAFITRCQELPSSRYEEIAGFDLRRRNTLPAGAVIVREVMKAFSIPMLTTSDRSLRDGLIVDWVEKHRPEIALESTVPDPRKRSVLTTMRRFEVDENHAQQVATLAEQLFDDTVELHELPVDDRALLRHAAMLHDLGHLISGKGHAKHGQYIIRNIRMNGFTAPEVEVLANLVRYHSRSEPKLGHPAFAQLRTCDRRRVRLLAGMLKIADGLDRSHNQRVARLEATIEDHRLLVEAHSSHPCEMERWAAEQRTTLLSEAFGRPIELEVVHTP